MVLEQRDDVREAFVLPVQHAGNTLLAAWYVGETNEEELRAWLGARLPGYMTPTLLAQIPEMPLNTSGKLNRTLLVQQVPSLLADSQGHSPPRNRLERELAEIWSEILQVEPIGIHGNFFHLGGHSLSASRVVTQIRERYGLEIPLKTLFQHATISTLARELVSVGITLQGPDSNETEIEL